MYFTLLIILTSLHAQTNAKHLANDNLNIDDWFCLQSQHHHTRPDIFKNYNDTNSLICTTSSSASNAIVSRKYYSFMPTYGSEIYLTAVFKFNCHQKWDYLPDIYGMIIPVISEDLFELNGKNTIGTPKCNDKKIFTKIVIFYVGNDINVITEYYDISSNTEILLFKYQNVVPTKYYKFLFINKPGVLVRHVSNKCDIHLFNFKTNAKEVMLKRVAKLNIHDRIFYNISALGANAKNGQIILNNDHIKPNTQMCLNDVLNTQFDTIQYTIKCYSGHSDYKQNDALIFNYGITTKHGQLPRWNLFSAGFGERRRDQLLDFQIDSVAPCFSFSNGKNAIFRKLKCHLYNFYLVTIVDAPTFSPTVFPTIFPTANPTITENPTNVTKINVIKSDNMFSNNTFYVMMIVCFCILVILFFCAIYYFVQKMFGFGNMFQSANTYEINYVPTATHIVTASNV